MEQSTIDIGITVNATIYLHSLDIKDKVWNIPAKDVDSVTQNDKGETVVNVNFPPEEGNPMPILVTENKEDVETAVANALYYRKEALDRIKSLLQG